MKRLFCVSVMFCCITFTSKINACKWIEQVSSDTIWVQWFSEDSDNNVEILEMRNEYIYCRLLSDDCCQFLSFLSNLDDAVKWKIEQELQNPINDAIDLDNCIQNIKACNSLDNSTIHWLIDNLEISVNK